MKRRVAVSVMLSAVLMQVPGAHAVAQDTAQVGARDTAKKARPPLLRLLEEASRGNRLPDDLMAYKARVETEIVVLLRRPEGHEQVAAIEQVASTLRWTRAGYYDQRVIGHRAQQAGFTISMLSIAPTGWVQPNLYGSRFRLRSRVASDTSSWANNRARSDGADTMPVVHPLAPDREQWYRFSGGDTVVTMRVQDRSIPIVLVRVQPREDLRLPVVLFDGEVALDASRGTLVRVRGHFVRAGNSRSWPGTLGTAVAFVEYEQGERAGKYWLPSRQRIELQAAAPMFGETRAVVRIASRVLDMQVNDTTLDARTLAAADSTQVALRRRLSFAPSDSLARYDDWMLGLGAITAGMHADDFNDVGPDRWRPTGKPRFDLTSFRASDVVRFNRVEGLFTGVGVRLAMRDLAPGVVARATGGYAWNEQTVRGRVSVERKANRWMYALRAGRSLDITNDFRFPFDSGTGLLAGLSGGDPYDYVDRRSATIAAVREIGRRSLLGRAELGYADDRYRPASIERGVFGRRLFRENRFIDEGGYIRSAALIEWNPDVSAEFVKPGIGARVSYERGDGTIDFQRAEFRAVARRHLGPLVATSRLDIGALFGSNFPPQQLFEIGQQQNLPGYGDKEFAGSRAALARGQLLYISPFLKQPLRITRRIVFPGLNPGVSMGIQAGWTDAPTVAARKSIDRLRPPESDLLIYAPLSRPTDGVRATVSAGLRLFAGAMFMGFARPVDQSAPWKLTFGGAY